MSVSDILLLLHLIFLLLLSWYFINISFNDFYLCRSRAGVRLFNNCSGDPCIAILYLFKISVPIEHMMFLIPLAMLIVHLIVTLSLEEEIGGDTIAYATLLILLGIPAELGRQFGKSGFKVAFYPAQKLYELIVPYYNGIWMPLSSGDCFYTNFENSMSLLIYWVPRWLAAFLRMDAYFIASSRYLIISAVIAQLLIVLLAIKTIEMALSIILLVFIYTATLVRKVFHSEKSIVPVGGLIFLAAGEAWIFLVKTVAIIVGE